MRANWAIAIACTGCAAYFNMIIPLLEASPHSGNVLTKIPVDFPDAHGIWLNWLLVGAMAPSKHTGAVRHSMAH